MHIKYYIESRLLNTEINTTTFWNIRFSIDADTAVVSQAAPLSPPVENRYPIPLNYNRSGTISQGGGIEADFVFTLQVDPVLFKNFVKKISFLHP